MNYFRRLWIFFCFCQVVLSVTTLAYAADDISKVENEEPVVQNKIRYGNTFTPLPISAQAFEQRIADFEIDRALVSDAPNKPLLPPAQQHQIKRVRTIVHKLAPHALKWNEQVQDWQWEVELINSPEMRAYVLPGGKIIIYSGMFDRLWFTDNEIALLLAHQIVHALREHLRAHLHEAPLLFETDLTPSLLFGLEHPSLALPDNCTQFLSLRYSHTDETEADVIGADIAARAGYHPRAAIRLWQRLNRMSHQTQVDLVAMHPFITERIRDFKKRLPELLPIYRKARRKAVKSAALARSRSARSSRQ